MAVDIDEQVRQRISTFMDGLRGFAPDVRWVGRESFHITLKFIGEHPAQKLEALKASLHEVRGAHTSIKFSGTGFFPTPKSARVFWVGMEYDENLSALAAAINEAASGLGIEREERDFKPHLTLARSGSGRPQWKSGDRTNNAFRRLQEKLAALPQPEFGTMTAHDFFLYESKLSPSGARYTRLERFVLEEAAH